MSPGAAVRGDEEMQAKVRRQAAYLGDVRVRMVRISDLTKQAVRDYFTPLRSPWFWFVAVLVGTAVAIACMGG